MKRPVLNRPLTAPMLQAVLLLSVSIGSAWAYGPTAPANKPPAAARAPLPAAAARVDINNASAEQLKTLPAIGDAEAARIIAARPYPSKAKLVAEKVLSFEDYSALKHRIVAKQKLPPKAAKPARNADAKAASKPAGPT